MSTIKLFLWIFIILNLIVNLKAAVIATLSVDVDTNLEPSTDFIIAKCRQRCYIRMLHHSVFRLGGLNSESTLKKCYKVPDCYMCHDYCHVLNLAGDDLATAMCSDKLFCSKGCNIACKFHRIQVKAIELLNNT